MRAFSASSGVASDAGSGDAASKSAEAPSYEEMLKRWASALQWASGTRLNAAAAVWRAEMGTVISGVRSDVAEDDEAFLLGVGVYGGRLRVGMKNDRLRSTNSWAFV